MLSTFYFASITEDHGVKLTNGAFGEYFSL